MAVSITRFSKKCHHSLVLPAKFNKGNIHSWNKINQQLFLRKEIKLKQSFIKDTIFPNHQQSYLTLFFSIFPFLPLETQENLKLNIGKERVKDITLKSLNWIIWNYVHSFSKKKRQLNYFTLMLFTCRNYDKSSIKRLHQKFSKYS